MPEREADGLALLLVQRFIKRGDERLVADGGFLADLIRVPFADRSELKLSKVGQELIVRAGREKRTIILPTALARHRPAGAHLEAGTLEISFEDERPRAQRTAADGEPEPTPGPAATRRSRQRV